KENAIATPTMKRKNGKTRSVGVQPFHCACCSGQYALGSSPALLTRIIAAIVAPRNTSRETKRLDTGRLGFIRGAFPKDVSPSQKTRSAVAGWSDRPSRFESPSRWPRPNGPSRGGHVRQSHASRHPNSDWESVHTTRSRYRARLAA